MGLHSKSLTMEGHLEPINCNSALNCGLIRNNWEGEHTSVLLVDQEVRAHRVAQLWKKANMSEDAAGLLFEVVPGAVRNWPLHLE